VAASEGPGEPAGGGRRPASGAAEGSAGEVFAVAFRLGLTSFGGPIAPIGCVREAYVVRRPAGRGDRRRGRLRGRGSRVAGAPRSGLGSRATGCPLATAIARSSSGWAIAAAPRSGGCRPLTAGCRVVPCATN